MKYSESNEFLNSKRVFQNALITKIRENGVSMENTRCSLIKVTFKDTFVFEALKTVDNNSHVN